MSTHRTREGIYDGLTLERFAALPAAWFDTLETDGGGLLIARVHPRNNRPAGDEDVLARALVVVYHDPGNPSGLRRLTVRTEQISERNHFVEQHRNLLQSISRLPVIELLTESQTKAITGFESRG